MEDLGSAMEALICLFEFSFHAHPIIKAQSDRLIELSSGIILSLREKMETAFDMVLEMDKSGS